jgi:DNA-binding NarL/FixJ family response regulator
MALQLAPEGLALGAAAVIATAPVAPPRLTPRQQEVLSLVAQGLPNKLIASALGIAERTVKLHVTALLYAMGARNRTHLLVVARDGGLI